MEKTMTDDDTTARTTPHIPDAGFVTTRWTAVLAAGRQSSPRADVALEELCRTYWYPLYAYVRRRGRSKEDAEDLTQAFFERFLQKNYLEGLSSERGRFRAFLLASLKHFLANEWDRAGRRKRGAHAAHLPLDWHDADTRYQFDLRDDLSPDKLYDRAWAVALLERVMGRLRDACAADGKAAQFEQLKPWLTADRDAIAYPQAAAALGISGEAARVAVHRLRRRYRDLLREEIAETLAEPAQVAEEMRALFAAFK
jgi:DNA-directed RNA polymerase specialized sigma24 family protein